MDPLKVILHPSGTEKAIRLMDSENKLVFVVDKKADKADIKKALEETYGVKVVKVNTYITNRGEKKAYVRLADEFPAIDLATKLGMM
jgi:large subunit ribosomal protein L23